MTLILPTLNYVASDYLSDTNGKPASATFTRATGNAAYVNALGNIAYASAGTLRHDFDPVTGEYKGWLIEEARTNLALYSRDLTNAAWTAVSATTAKTQTGADGVTNSASLITATGANATVLQAITDTSKARYLTAYVKRVTGTGAISMTMDNGATWTAVTGLIDGAGPNGYARCYIPTQTLADPTVGFKLATSGDAIAVDFVQIENGTISTSPIATTSASATRNADVLTVDTSGFAFNAAEGTLFVDAADCGATGGYFAALSSDGNNLVGLYADTSDIYARVKTDDVFVMAADIGNFGPSKKLAIAYKANDCAAVENGGTVVTDASAALPAIAVLGIGSLNGANLINGHVRHVAYFPRRLADADLQTITG